MSTTTTTTENNIPITTGGLEYADRVGAVIAAAFSRSPYVAYTLRGAESTPWPSTEPIPSETIVPHYQCAVAKKASMGAELVEAGNWAAVAVWFPPDTNYIPPEEDHTWSMREYWAAFTPVKQQHLCGRKHWYLSMIGRHPERRDRGVVRALIDPYLQRARAQGVPVWLEAISEHSRQVYEHLSFRTVAEVRLGVGKVNAQGEPDEKGKGMVLFGMIAE